MKANNGKEIRTPGLDRVELRGGLIERKQRTNREATLPIEYRHLEDTHRLEILKGTWNEQAGYTPHIFWDSDVAKWLEAAAYSLQSVRDEGLEERCDEVVEDLAALQEPDGYLNSYFSQVEPEARWTNVRDRHELYCAGHLMEAATAYAAATGKRRLLEVMCRYADYIRTVFGREPDRKRGYPGHEEIELALVKLYRATGERRYLDLSKYFIDERGRQPHYFDEEAVARGEDPGRYRFGGYDELQAHLPVREQKTAEGHSVRAGYLYAGMADVARETADEELADACRTLWTNITERRMYVHGGIGSSHVGERFTFDYDLPNEEAYAETCAAIALVFFAQRMFLLDREARYIDVLERALYNGVLSGVSDDGTRFFYDNYLASRPGYHRYHGRKSPDRQEWFGCACCPPNLARLLASIAGYLFAASDDNLWLNLYADYEAETEIGDTAMKLRVSTDYPWDGAVRVVVSPERPRRCALRLRIPGWCDSWSCRLNEETIDPSVEAGYAVIDREWSDGDTVELLLDMPVRRVYSHPSIRHNTRKVSLARGPVVYCLEEADNGTDLNNLTLPRDAELQAERNPDLLGGVVTISGVGCSQSYDGWDRTLYRSDVPAHRVDRPFLAIPYYAWDNRGVGEMIVWINEE